MNASFVPCSVDVDRMPMSGAETGSVNITRSHSSEVKEHRGSHCGRLEASLASGRPLSNGNGPKLWPVVLSVLGSAVAVAAVGCFCALLYPILKELRGERVRGQDGTEVRMLGFWSILVLSVLVGCTCFVFSWLLTYLDLHQPGTVNRSPAPLRSVSDHGAHMCFGVAVLNGIMCLLTVIWSLT